MSSELCPVLSERARAKVNLSLAVLGRRNDGFHELDSLVAFADVADVVTLTVGIDPTVQVYGPFAGAIEGENLAERALALAKQTEPALALGAIAIEKHLPVAAGVGGGSADAAAVLRLLQRANPRLAERVDWFALAAKLGSDVPVCLASTACRMTGRGETLVPLQHFAPVAAVLVNPQAQVPADKTRQVFKRLAAQTVALTRPRTPIVSAFDATATNDLQAAAAAVIPAIQTVLDVLGADALTLVSRLSGAGPTCFALVPHKDDAFAVAERIAARHPKWWVRAATLS